jgi:zinc transport system permease protein
LTGFFEAVADHVFMRNALIAGLLASVACGVIGTYVVTRRISLIAGSLAHSVLGGMGAAYYLRVVHGLNWLHPLHGAIAAALLAAFIIAAVRTYSSEREDTIISAMWAVGMALGIVFIFRTPGYKTDLMTYLFGNIVMADVRALQMLIVLDIIVVTTGLLFYHQLLAVCFDEEFARIRGLRTGFYYTLLLCLTAVTIVTLIYVVGIVLVIALLTLPVAIAGHFSRKLWQMMLLSALLSAIFTTLGLAISYEPDLPAGATTILLAGTVYATVKILSKPLRRFIRVVSARKNRRPKKTGEQSR